MTELRELRYLVTIVDEGQLSAAAKKLHVAQPALSYAIRRLERAYGVQLLERHARGVRPTPEGDALVARARTILSQADDLEVMAQRWAADEAATLVLGALPLSLDIIDPVVAAVAREHPDLRVTLQQLDFTNQRAELRRGRIDAEIAAPAPESNEFAMVEIARVKRNLWLAEDHPLAVERQVTVSQLRDLTIPGRHPDVPEDWWDALFLVRQREERPRETEIQPRTPEELWPMVAGGEAISIAPTYVGLRSGFPRVTRIPIADAEPLRVAVIHRRNDQRPAIKALAAAARNVLITG